MLSASADYPALLRCDTLQGAAGCIEFGPHLLSGGRRGYAKKTNKGKKQQATQLQQPQHHRHAPSTAELALVDFTEEQQRMDATVAHLKQELGSMRTGRASPGMLDHIKVQAYDDRMPLNALATVLARDAQLLVASVYDPGTVHAVEKAIRTSPLGLNPRIEGQDVLVPVPRPTPDTLEAMVKLCRQEVEAAKVSVRTTRSSALKQIKQLPSEDERYKAEHELQQLTDKYIKDIEQLGAQKAKEISTV